MKVKLSSAELLPSLVEDLGAARCLVRQLDPTSCRVTVLDAEGPDEGLAQLSFFVSAWTASYPGVAATVTA